MRGLVAGPVVGAFVGTLLGAAFVAVALALSRLYPARAVLPLMLSLHVPIALLEAALTGAILVTLLRWRPDLVRGLQAGGPPASRPAPVLGVIVVALAVAAFLAPLASSLPDGLESVAEQLGFAGAARSLWPAPAPGYELPWAALGRTGAALAGADGDPGRRFPRLGALARAGRASSEAPQVTPPRAGLVLGTGLTLTILAALAPAGLARPSVPPWSWAAWALAFAGGAAAFRAAGSTLAQFLRRLAWLLPFVLVLVLARGAPRAAGPAPRDGPGPLGPLARRDDRRGRSRLPAGHRSARARRPRPARPHAPGGRSRGRAVEPRGHDRRGAAMPRAHEARGVTTAEGVWPSTEPAPPCGASRSAAPSSSAPLPARPVERARLARGRDLQRASPQSSRSRASMIDQPRRLSRAARCVAACGAGERWRCCPNGAGKSTLLLHLAGLLRERQRYLHRHDAAQRRTVTTSRAGSLSTGSCSPRKR